MDIHELEQFIEASEFTQETKKKVAIILAGKAVLDYDTYAAIKEILQQELDADFEKAGVDVSSDPDVQNAEAQYQAELDRLNAEIEEDERFIAEETKKLEAVTGEIKQIENQISEKETQTV